MQLTLPPLLAMEVMSRFCFFETGKEAVDLSPVKGATMLACAPLPRVATAAEETIEEAIVDNNWSLVSPCIYNDDKVSPKAITSSKSNHNHWIMWLLTFQN